jgi:hypothetical protein
MTPPASDLRTNADHLTQLDRRYSQLSRTVRLLILLVLLALLLAVAAFIAVDKASAEAGPLNYTPAPANSTLICVPQTLRTGKRVCACWEDKPGKRIWRYYPLFFCTLYDATRQVSGVNQSQCGAGHVPALEVQL